MNKYVEGNSLTLGVYLPTSESVQGIEIMHYLNGCIVKASSNQLFKVERNHSVTNDYLWGMVTIRESTDTTVGLKK